MNLEINRHFKTSAIMKYEGEGLKAHLMKRGQGIDRQIPLEEIKNISKSPIILANYSAQDSLS